VQRAARARGVLIAGGCVVQGVRADGDDRPSTGLSSVIRSRYPVVRCTEDGCPAAPSLDAGAPGKAAGSDMVAG